MVLEAENTTLLLKNKSSKSKNKNNLKSGVRMFCDFGEGDSLLDLFIDSVPFAAGTEDVETMFGLDDDSSDTNSDTNGSDDSSAGE